MKRNDRSLRLKYGCLLGIFLICVLSPLFLPRHAEARSYTIQRWVIDAQVLPDASMQVTERLSIDFSGQWNGFYLTIPQGNTPIKEISVSENGRAYTFNPGTEYGPPGTYLVKNQGGSVLIDWSIQAQDQKRSFDVSYRVINAVQVHKDVAELYRKFIGEANQNQVGEVIVNLKLPPGAEQYQQGQDIRIWGHGPLQGEVDFAGSDIVVWQVKNLPYETFVEGRVVMPVQLFPQASAQAHTGKVALPGILAEEEDWAGQANRERWLARIGNGGALTILFIIPALLVGLWFKFGRSFPTSFEGDYYRDLPGEYSPAELSVLWNFNKIKSQDLTATILDLARRKFLRIEEETIEVPQFLVFHKEITTYRLTFVTPPEPAALRKPGEAVLKGHEQKLLDYLHRTIGDGNDSLTLHDVEEFAKDKSKEFYSFWTKWTDGIKKQTEPLKFFDDPGKMPIITFLAGLGIFILGCFLVIPMTVLGVAMILGGAILAIVPLFFTRRSVSGEEDMARWQAFRRFLLDFSEMQRHEIPSLVIWEHYLVYAVTLGVAEEVIKQLELVFPNMQEDDYHFGQGWITYRSSGGMAALPASFNNIVSAMDDALSSAMTAASRSSSGSGGGGGFSGGGGGGGGGSSAGGR
ncbi:MAG: DUF2207 domain-containing protein [Syntrophomonadaceae bacterium]